ncbi:hypothetical protein [Sulfitobacter sediminilitoris]|uniref:hypothetical protein n=1 Tax=Sulfitobacter sediminilitoris TaxID=2698830 RepID=UPI00361CC8CD
MGVGKALTGNATATEISNAAQIILGATSFTQRAKELGKMISRYEGPENAATEIEAAITV